MVFHTFRPFRTPRHRHGHDAQPLILGLLPFQRPLRAQVLHKATREDAGKGACLDGPWS